MPDDDGEGLYILGYNGVTEIHTVFEDFTTGVAELIQEGYSVLRLHATGQFDPNTATLTAEFIEIRLR